MAHMRSVCLVRMNPGIANEIELQCSSILHEPRAELITLDIPNSQVIPILQGIFEC